MDIKKDRSSNFELLRIILILVIIAHHYVVNSGINGLYDFKNISGNMLFLQFLGFGGKMAINAFVLISAYFICNQRLTYSRVLKLILEIQFYQFIIYIAFLILGLEIFSMKRILKVIFPIIYGINSGFAGSFIAFYLFIPFLNKFVKMISNKTHLILIMYLIFLFTIVSTFFMHNTWNYVGWFITLYFIASYIRFYPNVITDSKKIAAVLLAVSILLIYVSILVVDFYVYKFNFTSYYYFCENCHKLLALMCGLSFFLLLRNIKIKHSYFINTLAASTFGVFLIHTNSEVMRSFLWKDIFNNVSFYNSKALPFHFLISIILIYIVCTGIDFLRIRYLEMPLFKWLDRFDILKRECFFN